MSELRVRMAPASLAAGVTVAAIGAGVAVAARPAVVFAGVLVAAVVMLLVLASPTTMPALVLVGTAVVPVALLAAQDFPLIRSTPLNGQARLLVLLTCVVLFRVAIDRIPFAWPVAETVAIGVFVCGLLLSAVVAVTVGNDYDAMLGDLARQLVYPLAFLAGIASASYAESRGAILEMYRRLAVIVGSLAAFGIVYWLWSTGRVPAQLGPVEGTFESVRQASRYGESRSAFPFVQDSPNLAAVIFVAAGAYILPHLIFTFERRDRRLALVAGALVVGVVLATQSRTGLIAIGAAGLCLLLLMLRSRSQRRRVLQGLAVLAVAVGVGYSLFPDDRVVSLRVDNFVVREGIWREATDRFMDRPLFGQGYHYSGQEQFLQAIPSPAIDAPTARYYSIHNDYLGQLVDGGVVGGIILLAVIGTVLRLARRLLRMPGLRIEGVSLACLAAVLAPAMASNAVFQSAAASIVTLLFFGIAAGRARMAGAD